MGRKRGKKSTPPHLDKYFARNVITEDQYKLFWPEYWKAETPKEREAIVDKFTKEVISPPPPPPPPVTNIRKSEVSAKRDVMRLAKETGNEYRIARRDRFGRFNSRGRSYQAIRKGKSK